MKILLLVAGIFLVSACSESENKTVAVDRWYSAAQVQQGYALYQANCASCHKPDASGSLPGETVLAPALNGTAHTWHHPMKVLKRTIQIGGKPLGGTMPGFTGKLSETEIEAILAWVQSHWNDAIYLAWEQRDKKTRAP